MAVRQHHFDTSHLSGEAKILKRVLRVLHAVFDVIGDPDPVEVRKFYSMLKPGDPLHLRHVTIKEEPKITDGCKE